MIISSWDKEIMKKWMMLMAEAQSCIKAVDKMLYPSADAFLFGFPEFFFIIQDTAAEQLKKQASNSNKLVLGCMSQIELHPILKYQPLMLTLQWNKKTKPRISKCFL